MLLDLESGRRWEQPCDTLIVAAGLTPERTLLRGLGEGEALPDWLKLSGNCEYVHDIVDAVTREGLALGGSLPSCGAL